MGANQTQQSNARFFKIVAKAEKADPKGKKAICEVIKQDDQYVTGDWYSSVSGYIVRAEVKTFEYEGQPKKKCVLILMDGHETCQLEFSFNFATFGLINAMNGADLTREVEISAWIGKNGFVGASIRYVGEQENIQWSIPLEDSPKGDKYFTPGGEEKVDYTNVQKFWESVFLDITTRCVRTNLAIGAAPKQAALPAAQTNEAPEIVYNPTMDDDLPF